MPKANTLGFLMAETARLLRTAFEREMIESGLGVTSAEARALAHVASHEGSRQTEIAERMGVEPMTVCAYLDRLERAGLVVRQPDPRDRRAKNVHTTPMADEILIQIRKRAAALYDELLHDLAPAERDLFMHGLSTLRDNLRSKLDLSAEHGLGAAQS
jgi:MarR family transcriptional regulator for hemolysin